MRGLLDPKMDFVFKNIFGSEKNPKILISFLNATLKPKYLITSAEVKKFASSSCRQRLSSHIHSNLSRCSNTDYIEDRLSTLSVKATTSNNEIINIEIQLKNEYNMIKRSLYYWSKLYLEQLNEGEDYNILKRTICINILNFKYLKTRKFHSGYRLKEIYSNEELTDVTEIHFIEIPKLEKYGDERDMLVNWVEFLKDPESEKVRSLEMNIEEIRQAKDELIRMINDDTQREIYEMRAKTLRGKVSALNEAERKGIQKGIEEGEKNKAIEIAKSLLDVLDIETISLKTGLSIDEINKLK